MDSNPRDSVGNVGSMGRNYRKIKVSSLSIHGEKSGCLRSSPLGWDGEETSPYPINQEKKKIP